MVIKLLKENIVVQSLSRVRLFVTPWTAAHQAYVSFTISPSLLKLMSLSQWCHPTISSSVTPFSSCPQSFPASGFFQWVSFLPTVLQWQRMHLPKQEMQVWSLDWEDPLEKETATWSSILAWEIPWTEEPGGLQSMGSQRVGHNWETNTFTSLSIW